MLRQVKQVVTMCVMAVAVAVISLPAVSFSATSPTVTVLSPITKGLGTPVKFTLDAAGNIYLADINGRQIVAVDPSGTQLLGSFPTTGIPRGVAFAQNGNLLVSQGSVVAFYDVTTGKEIGRLVGGQLVHATEIAIDDQTGYIYVLDSFGNKIEMYTADGNFVKSFGQSFPSDVTGAITGLKSPNAIEFEKFSRQLIVADTAGNRIRFFDMDGNYVKSIGAVIPGTATTFYTGKIQPMMFLSPYGIALEYTKDLVPVLNRIYITDSYQANIQVLDGATLTALNVAGASDNFIGAPGTANGLLSIPSDAIFDSVNNRLLVINGNTGITVYGIDGGSNPAFADLTPPTLTLDPVLANVNVSNITVSGTVEAGATVTITAGSSVVGNVVYTTATSWKADITSLLPGVNQISVVAKDAAGNLTTPKVATTTYTIAAPKLVLTSTIPQQTNIAVVTLSGTVDAESTVTITNNSTSSVGTATVVGTDWTYKATLAEGTNNLTIVAQKQNSEKSTLLVSTTVDSIAPVLNVSAIANLSNTSEQVQNIAGTIVDSSVVTVLVNEVTATLKDNSFSLPLSLVAGTNTITVVATDLAGNKTTNVRTVNFDAVAPVVTVLEPMDNSTTNNPVVQISGTIDEDATVTVSGVQAVVDNKTWTASVALSAGLNTVDVVATDVTGNSSTQKRTITFDSAKPVLAISYPRQDIAVNHNLRILGTVSDTDSTSVTYTVNGKTETAPIVDGKYSFKVVFGKDGIYPVIVTVNNSTGVSTTATRTLIYDTVPPQLTVAGNQFNTSRIITGTVEDGASVSIKDNGHFLRNVNVLVEGTSWSANLTNVNLRDKSITVVAKDAANNSTAKTVRVRR